MFLTELKINGFKSFANKTELKFSNGVTCIIGPNGCGKSNIVDAIRWVIGEQRAGSLRSDKMMDVIFNGNKKRKALGATEVSLTIINDKGVLPAEYSEIQITRRLYRSGQSEYLLNNNLCRLKDIQDLFMDTGMGSDAYSVIELKMIEQILSTNNDDRRILFEEAAGIKKYKQRRRSALRKLTDTRLNLVRINDILKEVQNNVQSLSRQVEKAKKYREYKQKLQELELQTAAFNFSNFMEKIEPIDNELNEVKMVQQDSNNQLSLDESLSEKIKFELLDVEQKLTAKRQEVFTVDDRLQAINKEELVLKEKKIHAENLISRLISENENFLVRKANANQIIEEKRNALEKIQDELDSFENNYNQSEEKYNEAQSEYASRQKKLAEAETSLRELQREINQKSQRIEQLNFQKTQFEDRLSAMKITDSSEKENLEKELEEQKSILDQENKALLELRNEIDKKQEEKEAKNNLIESLHRDVNEIESELVSLKSKRSFLNDSLLSGELLPDDIKRFQDKATEYPSYIGLLSDTITLKKSKEKELSRRLQYFASLPIFKDLDASGLSNLRKDFPNLRVLILPEKISKITPDKNAISAFIESSVLKQDEINYIFSNMIYLEDHKELSAYSDKPYIVFTPFGEYSYLDKTFKILSTEEPEFLILQTKNQLDDIDKRIDAIQGNFDTKNKEHLQQIDARKSLFDQIDELEIKRNEHLRSINQTNAKINQAKYQIDYIVNEINSKKAENESLNQKLKDAIDEHTTLYPLYESLIKKEKSFDENFEDLKRSTAEKSKDLNLIREEHHEMKIKRNDLVQNEQNLKELLKREYYFLKDVDDKVKANEDEIESLKTQIDDYAKNAEDYKKQIELLNEKREKLQGEKLSIEEIYQGKKLKIEEIESEIKSVQKRREEYLNRLQKLELKLNEYRIKSQTIHERIFNEYKIDIKNVPAPENFKLLKTENEIFNIKNSLINLGEVNSLAIEEFEKENERLTFLSSQYNDLVDAEDMLVETIDTINQTAKDKFDDVFEKIRLNFIKVFLNFFPNGEADLLIQDTDDPLDGRVEIKVSPKGKSLQTLSLMSGGEKTLTAISLLFAIYLVKPSPFCILDEVDAPLDDVNISRFTQAIRMFTNNTQFIIITHNKRTMEAADYMYGVTQEEEGVSKLVSVNFGQS